MRIKNRLYPYPILRPSIGDYLRSTFKCNITSTISENECIFQFDMVCDNATILELIKSGKAVYAIHLECKYTYYRILKCFSSPKSSFHLDGNLVDQQVEVCPVIMASDDIDGYTCSDLDSVYAGEHIVFKRGNPIAIGNQVTVEITKQKDNLKKLSQPFCVLPYPDSSPMRPIQKHASIDYSDNNQIIIYLPKEDFAIRFTKA